MAISLTSSGIVYTGTQTPAQVGGTAAAYTLDDYEEGTYVPVFAGASETIYLAGYTKIGHFVMCQCYGELASGTNDACVHSAAPFTNVTQGYSPGSLDYAAANENFTNPHVRAGSNSSTLEFLHQEVSSLAYSDIDGGHIIWSVTYRTP